ncbi:MAG: MerR family transcriptional regulator [Clostridiaceae bacterium]|nr:MerR family transcriptional regulator [Clostridiaceae bacterium]
MDLIKITDLSNQLDITSRSLRYYEQVGLIRSVRPKFEKYRYYDTENTERLKQIIVLRKMRIPIKDIVRIYESEDMRVVVQVFVDRMNEIDDEVNALSELKRIVNDFLQTMIINGISKISALPLLYDEFNKQLDLHEKQTAINYKRLAEVSEKIAEPANIRIIELPSMRMLSSINKETAASDVEGFWNWLDKEGIPPGMPGQHILFEFQNDASQVVFIQKIDENFKNDSPYADYRFEGGLFAVGCAYVDEDLRAIHRRIIKSFDDNSYFEVDYHHSGRLQHETLVESVISPDSKREIVDLLVPIKNRVPDASLYNPGEQIESVSVRDIEAANPVLWEKNVHLNQLIPILEPYYRVNEAGEAEYIAYIDKRLLSTGIEVKLPFRVDLEFRIDEASARFGYGTDEGSVRFFHGNNLFGINMDNNADSRLSKEAISFNQPVIGDFYTYPKRGRINPGEYNKLSWIVGEKHFAVIINGEVRYCGADFPYMKADLRRQQPYPIILGSNGQGKICIKSIRVLQLKRTPKIRIKEGELMIIPKQSNNMIPNIHQLITLHYGENYWFNGSARYVMECLGEPDYDYWFFAGLTGDNLAQVYACDHFRGDGATDYRLSLAGGARFIEDVFAACGYASTFVSINQLTSNKEMYLQTLIAYIDKGIPVILNHWGNKPRSRWGWGVFVGYEDYGRTLLYLTADLTEPERITFADAFPDQLIEGQETCNGWVFVGEKKNNIPLGQIYRQIITAMPDLLTRKTDAYLFGAEAFRAWAHEIESGRFNGLKPEEFDSWPMYTIYVCNLATNSSCCHEFFTRAQKLNPDFTFLEDVDKLYQQMSFLWNNQNGEDLEAIGGGFNITLDALQDQAKRDKIVAKILEFASCMDRVVQILKEHLHG